MGHHPQGLERETWGFSRSSWKIYPLRPRLELCQVAVSIVRLHDGTRQSILHSAIASGSVSAFEGVLTALRRSLPEREVRRIPRRETARVEDCMQDVWTCYACVGILKHPRCCYSFLTSELCGITVPAAGTPAAV